MKKRKDGRYEKSIVVNNKRKTFYGNTQREVLEKIIAYEEKKENGRTFREVAEQWEEEHEKKVEISSMKPIIPSVKRAIERFGDTYIKDITAGQLQAHIEALGKQGLSAKTVTHNISTLNMIFRHALLAGDITNDPMTPVKLPSGLKRTPRELPSERDMQLVIANTDSTIGLLAFTAMFTGMRRGELLGLMYEDIDWDKRNISVKRSIGFKGNAPYIKTPKTTAGTRTIFIFDELYKKLPHKSKGLIFEGKYGIFRNTEIKNEYNHYREQTGVECTLHQLRHALATFAFESGMQPKDMQELLGHADFKTTMEIYTHISNSRKEENNNQLNNFLSSKFRQ